MIKIQDFKFNDWTSQWAGNWSFLSFSYWGDLYSQKPFTDKIDKYISHTIMITREGKSTAYQRSTEKEKFGRKFNKLVSSNKNYINQLCYRTKVATNNFLKFTKKFHKKDITFKQYLEFQNLLVNQYYPLHIQIKVGVDYLAEDLLEKYFSHIELTRKYIRLECTIT